MSDWQPIESAPKDGTPVILGTSEPGFYPRSAWFSQEFDEWVVRENIERGEATFINFRNITHWMPLPNPPISGSGGDNRT